MNLDEHFTQPGDAVVVVRRAAMRSAGGEGSGNYGHAGRPGEVGGSAEGGGDQKEIARREFFRLKAKYAAVNNELFLTMDHPDSASARHKLHELKAIVKEMHTLDADPGDLEGIGLPGGPRDMVVVGAGPGGLAAAVMGGAEGLDTLVIDANTEVGGQAKHSSRVENFPGFPAGVSGDKLAADMHNQALRLGASEKLGVRVTGIEHDPVTDLKTVTLSNGEKIQTRSVVLASGLEFTKVEFPGSESADVIYADSRKLAEQSKGKYVVVAGGSNGAAQAALLVAQHAKHVTLLSRSRIEKSMSDYQVSAVRNHPNITVVEGASIKSHIPGSLSLDTGRTVKADKVGVFFGANPNTSYLPATMRREHGRIVTNDSLETDIPGIFAVGDMRHKGIGRIGAAVGDGQLATRSVYQYFEALKARKKL